MRAVLSPQHAGPDLEKGWRRMGQVRNVVVTGAGSGIGRAAAVLFANRGDYVSCWDIREPPAEETASSIRQAGGLADAVRCDVSTEGDVVEAFAKLEQARGGADVVFVNAGIEGALKPLIDVDLLDFETVLRVNLVGAFLLCKHGVPQLRNRGGGAIVMTSSVLAHVSTSDWGAYGASKGGLVALARSLAVEYGRDGIRVNCVAPDGVSTELMHRGLVTTGLDESAASAYEATLATPEQIAEVVHFLASPGAGLINGVSLLLDRGLTAARPN